MVKGISRQVIVVQSPNQELFDQAIFVLKDDIVNAKGVTDDLLLKEAQRLINAGASKKRASPRFYAAVWSGIGAFAMGILWAVSALILA